MSKSERNMKIIGEFNRIITERGLAGKLEVDPISNTFKRRQHFTTKADGTGVFTAFMWQLNELNSEDCITEINRRIDSAVRFLG